jgi:hypothetical protein
LQQASKQWDGETRNDALRDFCFNFYANVPLFSAMLLQTKNRFEIIQTRSNDCIYFPERVEELQFIYLFTDFNSFWKNWLENESCPQAGKVQAPAKI